MIQGTMMRCRLTWITVPEMLRESSDFTSGIVWWCCTCALCVMPRICAEWNLRTRFRVAYGIPGAIPMDAVYVAKPDAAVYFI